MTFITENGLKSTISINVVKPTLTKDEANALMDIIIAKDVFAVESGAFVRKDSAKLTERKVTEYEVA